MNRQKGSILIVLLLLLAGAGLVFVGYKYAFKKTEQKTIVPSAYPLETIEPTDNWKTYTDTESEFSLKYPDAYFKFQGDPSLGFFAATSPTQGGNGPKFLPNKNDVWLGASVSKNTNIQTIEQYFTLQQNSYNNAVKTSISIDGVNGYKVAYNMQVYCAGSSCTTMYEYDGLVLKDSNLYTVSLSSLDKTTLDADATLFDQILSTFKFTE